MVVVLVICLNHGYNCVRPHESGDVVHVSVRVIPCNPAVHPQNLIDSQAITKGLFDLFAAHSGIPLLHLAQ